MASVLTRSFSSHHAGSYTIWGFHNRCFVHAQGLKAIDRGHSQWLRFGRRRIDVGLPRIAQSCSFCVIVRSPWPPGAVRCWCNPALRFSALV
jgi:hypothetical protein